MNEKEFEKLVKKLAKELNTTYEFIDEFDVEFKPFSVWFTWDEETKCFRISSAISLEDLWENFEEIVGLESSKWTPKIRKLWNKLVDSIVSEIGQKFSIMDVDGEFIHLKFERKEFDLKEFAKIIKEMDEFTQTKEEEFKDWRVIYNYISPEEIRKAILSKLKYVCPIEIKPFGGSYHIIIPKEALRLLIDENALKTRKTIKAKLTVFPDEEEIKINSIEY